ncbi:MAG: putative thioesterase [Gammaproteobacteria bacterium]|nr:MAG: putative thioesterase [Gammaproteobacteria bacterium]
MGVATQHIATGRIQDSIWFQVPNPVNSPRMRLFCFSYAGGNASAFRGWYKNMPSDVEICSVQLPGRGARFKEKSFTSLSDLLFALDSAFQPYLDVPFAFFGHSMGAQVAFEFAKRLRDKRAPQPEWLFVSGRRAPHLPQRRKTLHNLPEDEFREEILKLDGTPAEAIENPELMELVSPILRADCQVIETWKTPDAEPLVVPIVACGGAQDEHVTIEELENWSHLTKGPFEMRLFSGGHFYIHSATDSLLECVASFIQQPPGSHSCWGSSNDQQAIPVARKLH